MAEEDKAQCVKVAIRCRPQNTKEVNSGEANIVEIEEAFVDSGAPGGVVLNDPAGNEEPAKFKFDIVFGLSVRQEDVYNSIGLPALNKTFEGYNGTIFAYGQTGSGKSWSMSGMPKDPDLRGIIPRMNDALFERIGKEQVGTRKFLVMCSYFEIYNEIIFDLLNPVSDKGKLGGGLQIKEHPVMGIYVKDLTEIVADNPQRLEELLDSGQKSRAVSSTMMNATSSRSHSIFTVKVHQKDEEDKSKNVFAKLNLVDLAGSERQKGTGATGQTLKEGANINKSLSALGNVINALVECANGKKVFIPYRNSKLTRVLQESLGGNSLCTMLAALSPAACNYEETMSTLRYANRAKAIKVTATKNEEASQISRLKAEVEALRAKLEAAGGRGGSAGSGGLTEEEKEAEKAKFEQQLREMEAMMNNNWTDKEQMSKEHQQKLQRLQEEQHRAAQALEEERSRRLRLLREKSDLELTIRGFIDFVLHLPKFNSPPPVITGEMPRLWLKTQRSLRQDVSELKEHHNMVMVLRHQFQEDAKLCAEASEAHDYVLAATGLARCLPKLDKLSRGGQKLSELEARSLNAASEIADGARQSAAELSRFRQQLADDTAEGDEAKAGAGALEEVATMLTLVERQVQETIERLAQHSRLEMGQPGEAVLRFARSFIAEGGDDIATAEALAEDCNELETFMRDPRLAALPRGMPQKPLRQYEPSDCMDTPDTTEALLGQLIPLEAFCGGKTRKSASELLARPPPKFVWDVASAIRDATGFPPDLDRDWPEAREDRLANFRRAAEAAGAALGVQVDFDPEMVLKGKEVPKTLRLMQLLAVAAARTVPADGAAATFGLARARELPAITAVMERCLRSTKEQVEARRKVCPGSHPDEQSLEEKIALAEQQLQEANAERRQQEDALAGAERELQATQAEVKKVESECQLGGPGPGGADGAGDAELAELERQLGELSAQADLGSELSAESVLRMLSVQIEQVRRDLSQGEADVGQLEEQHMELQSALGEAERRSRQADAEVQRERQRLELDEELNGQSAEGQKLILRDREEKLRARAAMLDEQVAAMQADAEERKAANLMLVQEKKYLEDEIEEAYMDIKIVEEERDSIREAMETLWKEKADVETELEERMESYVDLSERLNTHVDQTCELQALVEQKRQEIESLRSSGFHGAVAA